MDKLGALYDERKRLTEETQKDEDAEPPKRRKLEDIEDEAMQAEDEDDLKRLYDEYRDEHTRKFIEDQMMEDEGDNEDPADNKRRKVAPGAKSNEGRELASSSKDPIARKDSDGTVRMDILQDRYRRS